MSEEQLDELKLNQSYDKINLIELQIFFYEFYKTNGNGLVSNKFFLKWGFLHNYLENFTEGANKAEITPIIRAYDKIMSRNHQSSKIVEESFGNECYKKQVEEKKTNSKAIIYREQFKINVMGEQGKGGIYKVIFEEGFSSENLDILFSELLQRCCVPHFSESDLISFENLYNQKNYAQLLHDIMFHAFSNAWRNLPYMYTERLYQESLTLRVTNPLKDQFLKLAADLGHRKAALEYGMRNYEPNLEEGIIYFLKACPQEAAYWTIAFQLEKKWQKIDDTLFEKIKSDKEIQKAISEVKELRSKDEKNNEFYIALVSVSGSKKKRERLNLAIKIYLYLCTKLHFTKAFNSIGKLLILGEIRVEDEKRTVHESRNVDYYPESRKQAFRFLNYAISIGNPHAMVNMARYWLDRRTAWIDDEIKEEAEANQEKAENWMRMMAEMREVVACEYYAHLLAEKGRGKEALKYYEYAIDQNSKSALLPAAKICESLGYYEKASKYNALQKFYLKKNKP